MIIGAAINGDNLSPQIIASTKYKHWVSIKDIKRCLACKELHGKIWLIKEKNVPEPPKHFNCRCKIKLMESIIAGTATINGIGGADWSLKYEQTLPDYYVMIDEVIAKGWKKGKSPSKYVQGKMITNGVYLNKNGHLPYENGRVWYEADINYKTGKRNSQRILWSNDGLIFVTYDHYETFYEIV